MGRRQHAAVIGEIQDVAVIVRVVYIGAGACNVTAGQRTSGVQPAGQVAYVQLNGVHDAIDRAGRICIVADGGVGHVVVAHFAFARVIEVDRPPVARTGDVGRGRAQRGTQLLQDQDRIGVGLIGVGNGGRRVKHL